MNRYRAVHDKYHCECSNVIPTRRKVGSGVVVWLQCSDCGRGVRAVRSKDYSVDSLPAYDTEKQEHRRAALSEELAAIRDQERSLLEQESAEWWSGYSAYLRSPRWRRLRDRVLQRDRFTCQACLSRAATQVHHLSYELYDRIGSSAAFECVAICEPCHHKIHPHMAETQSGGKHAA